jgi:hypothetical protein
VISGGLLLAFVLGTTEMEMEMVKVNRQKLAEAIAWLSDYVELVDITEDQEEICNLIEELTVIIRSGD